MGVQFRRNAQSGRARRLGRQAKRLSALATGLRWASLHSAQPTGADSCNPTIPVGAGLPAKLPAPRNQAFGPGAASHRGGGSPTGAGVGFAGKPAPTGGVACMGVSREIAGRPPGDDVVGGAPSPRTGDDVVGGAPSPRMLVRRNCRHSGRGRPSHKEGANRPRIRIRVKPRYTQAASSAGQETPRYYLCLFNYRITSCHKYRRDLARWSENE
jgi:hypothetical protein